MVNIACHPLNFERLTWSLWRFTNKIHYYSFLNFQPQETLEDKAQKDRQDPLDRRVRRANQATWVSPELQAYLAVLVLADHKDLEGSKEQEANRALEDLRDLLEIKDNLDSKVCLKIKYYHAKISNKYQALT